MDVPTVIARGLAAGRVALGVALIAAPERTTRGWLGPAAAAEGTGVVVRGVGARDIALGAGLLAALGTGGARRWVDGAVLADLADTAATLAGRGASEDGPRAAVALAAGSALLGLWLRSRVD